MKKFLSMFLLSLLISATTFASSLNGEYQGKPIVRVVVEGKVVTSEVPAYIDGGSTMLPMRAVSEALGAEITWDQATYTATVTMPKMPLPTKAPAQPTPKPEQPKLSQAEIERISMSVAKLYVYDADDKPLGQGTGFIIDGGKQGKLLISACHVGCIGPNMRVEINGQVIGLRNQMVFKNEQSDTFAAKIDTTSAALPYVTDKPKQGDTITEIGYPQGQYLASAGKVLSVSEIKGVEMITSSINVDGGGSGGAVLNSNGEIVALLVMNDINNHQSVSIPIEYVQKELDKLK